MALMDFLKQKKADAILQAFPGPIAEYLRDKVAQIDQLKEFQYSTQLTQSLKDPVKYLIFKLAAMPVGVTFEKVLDLFGSYGETQLQTLINEGLIELSSRGVYLSKIEHFFLSNEVFVDHFKTTADFIKPHKHATAAKSFSPIFSNFSSSINKKAYAEILKVQRAANKKITAILSDKNSVGEIPAFFLNAVDTLDKNCADEYPD